MNALSDHERKNMRNTYLRFHFYIFYSVFSVSFWVFNLLGVIGRLQSAQGRYVSEVYRQENGMHDQEKYAVWGVRGPD